MSENERQRPVRQNARPTIGLLTYGPGDPNNYAMWLGIDDVAREQGANLICFPGNPLRSPRGFEAQANVLYDLVSAENVDGLVIWGGALAHHVSHEEIRTFCERYRPFPLVNVGFPLEGIPSVLADYHQGMRDGMRHLIEVHGCRRIAFIRGPEGHPTAEDRYHAYVEVLAEYDIPFDPDLIAPGEFKKTSGMAAIDLLLDQRKADFEAVMAVDDDTAIGVMEALQARGIRVPGDMAVVGFDDIEEGRYVIPPLTTVPLLMYERGRRAAEMVLALLAGEEVPEQVVLPTGLVVRQSCGCLAPQVVQAATELATGTGETFQAVFATRRADILSEMEQALGASATVSEGAEQLLNAFSAEFEEESPGTFLSTLDEVLRQVRVKGGDVAAWQGALSVLRRYALPYLDNETLSRAENLWQQARVVIGETAQQVQAHQRVQEERQAGTLREIGHALITTFDIAGLTGVLAQELPRVEIERGYLSVYEEPESPAEWSRLILAYDEKGCAEPEERGQRFPSRQLVPDGLLPHDRRYSMVVEPLYFREAQLGFAVFEASPREEKVCDTLRGHISSALQGALLVQQTERRTLQLQAAAEVARAAAAVLDIEELMRTTVEHVSERFGFYHAGVFLVDEAREYAVLRAASSEGGRRMLERGHKLRVGEVGIVGYVAGTGEARIALDVGADAVFFDNPDLPGTRSEMSLPLRVRGKIIGVLDVQSTEPAAFSDEDVATLGTMADQLAMAIENARLLRETQERLREISHLYGEHSAVALARLTSAEYPLGYIYDRVGVVPMEKLPAPAFDLALQRGETVALTRSEAAEAMLTTPLKLRDQVIGAIGLEEIDKARPWTEEEVALVESVSDQVALALESASLFEEARIRAEELAVLNELGQALTARLNVEEVLKEAYRQASHLVDTSNFFIALYYADRDELAFVVDAREGKLKKHDAARPMGHGFTDYVVRNRAPVIIHENPLQWAAERGVEIHGRIPMSWMAVPLMAGGQVLGVMSTMDFTTTHAYDEHARDLLTAIASQTAIALQNARLFEEARSRAERLAVINRIARAAGAILHLDDLMETVYQEIAPAFQADTFFIALCDKETEELDFRFVVDEGVRESPGRVPLSGLTSLVVAEKKPLIIRDLEQEQDRLPEPVLVGRGKLSVSWLGVPMLIGERVIGVISVQSYRPHAWDEEDEQLLFTIADQVAVALENARLFQKAVETAERLAEMDRLKTQFLANMSHELRTPLNSIIGFSRVILKGIDGPITEQQRADLTSIHNNGQHLLGLINDVLDISRIEAGKMELILEPVDLQHIVQGVMSTAIALVKDKPIELKQEVADDLPPIRADGTRVRQVILNLLSNAAKFTEEGQITLQVQADEENVTISVTDTGIGISAEDQATLFQEFSQVDASPTRRAGGAGLGLAISRHLVELHGGRMWVESEPGFGSTFTFVLPIAGPEAERAEEPEALADLTISPDRELILAIEDDEGAITLYKRYLEKHGYQIVGLNEGEQAVRWARELSPCAIILDVQLPDKDGWTVLEELKNSRETRQIPLIICTILNDGEARALSMGAADYLVKPILEEDLLQSLERLEERQQV